MKAVIFISLFFSLTACANCSNGHPEDPEPVIRPAAGKELCPQACDRMAGKTSDAGVVGLVNEDGGVGCIEGKPVPVQLGEGDEDCVGSAPDAKDCMSCVLFCTQMHESGSFWNTSCIVNDITTCGEIESVCNTQ